MEEDKQTFGLRSSINKAAAVREMCQTPGFSVLKAAFEEKIKKVADKILDPDISDEEVSKLRKKVQVWKEVEKMLKTIMLTGELSTRALSALGEDLMNTSPEVSDKEN